jgi:hypothetical protein
MAITVVVRRIRRRDKVPPDTVRAVNVTVPTGLDWTVYR